MRQSSVIGITCGISAILCGAACATAEPPPLDFTVLSGSGDSPDGGDPTGATGGFGGGTGAPPAGTGGLPAASGGAPPSGGAGGSTLAGGGSGNGGFAPSGGTTSAGGLPPIGGSGGVPPGNTGGAFPVTGGSTGGGGAPPGGGATCTGKPGKPGTETRIYAKENLQYIVHIPAKLDPNVGAPLLFVAHGFTMSGALMQAQTGFDAVADREGFVVVYPNGHGAFPWNVGDGTCAPGALVNAVGADSFGYFDSMLAAIEADQCINPKQVFVAGFSMGGYFSNHMGCQRGNTFARAVGPHSGGTYPGACPGAPVPIILMHGASDTFIDVNACGGGARDYWVQRNKCGTTKQTRPVQGGSCDWYDGCDGNGQTVWCTYPGVAHAWAAGSTEASWSFFKAYL